MAFQRKRPPWKLYQLLGSSCKLQVARRRKLLEGEAKHHHKRSIPDCLDCCTSAQTSALSTLCNSILGTCLRSKFFETQQNCTSSTIFWLSVNVFVSVLFTWLRCHSKVDLTTNKAALEKARDSVVKETTNKLVTNDHVVLFSSKNWFFS